MQSEQLSRTATIVSVGDLMLGDSPICPGFDFARTFDNRDGGDPFADVDRLLEGHVVLGNLETPISRSGLNPDDWRSVQMRGHPKHARQLAEAGFSVLNVANNHACQHGEDVFWESVQLLRQAGIEVCGLAGAETWQSQPVLWKGSHDATVGVLGYSLRPEQYTSEPVPYAMGPASGILRDTRRLAAQADAVIVTLHWGDEFVDRPSVEQTELARRIAEAGASAVIGHHPHVVQPIEWHGGSIIAYSLGNFVTDMIWQERLRRGAMVRFQVKDRKVTDMTTFRTKITNDFRLVLDPDTEEVKVRAETDVALSEPAYNRAIRRTVRSQRLSAYRYAMENVTRYPSRMLFQLGWSTLKNKLGMLTR